MIIFLTGTLNFLPLSSFSSLYGDDVFSEYISTQGAFSFGTGTVYGVYVSYSTSNSSLYAYALHVEIP